MGIADEISAWLDSLSATELAARKKAAEERKARAEQALARLWADQRKADTRKKILVGAAVMTAARRDADFAARLRRVLDAAVTVPRDRALLGLAPLPPAEAGAPAPALCDDRR